MKKWTSSDEAKQRATTTGAVLAALALALATVVGAAAPVAAAPAGGGSSVDVGGPCDVLGMFGLQGFAGGWGLFGGTCPLSDATENETTAAAGADAGDVDASTTTETTAASTADADASGDADTSSGSTTGADDGDSTAATTTATDSTASGDSTSTGDSDSADDATTTASTDGSTSAESSSEPSVTFLSCEEVRVAGPVENVEVDISYTAEDGPATDRREAGPFDGTRTLSYDYGDTAVGGEYAITDVTVAGENYSSQVTAENPDRASCEDGLPTAGDSGESTTTTAATTTDDAAQSTTTETTATQTTTATETTTATPTTTTTTPTTTTESSTTTTSTTTESSSEPSVTFLSCDAARVSGDVDNVEVDVSYKTGGSAATDRQEAGPFDGTRTLEFRDYYADRADGGEYAITDVTVAANGYTFQRTYENPDRASCEDGLPESGNQTSADATALLVP